MCFLFNLPRFFEYHINSHSCGIGSDGAERTVFALSFGAVAGSWAYVWAYFTVAIVLPLVILAFCNVRLVSKLRQSRKFRRAAQQCVVDERHNTSPCRPNTV